MKVEQLTKVELYGRVQELEHEKELLNGSVQQLENELLKLQLIRNNGQNTTVYH